MQLNLLLFRKHQELKYPYIVQSKMILLYLQEAYQKYLQIRTQYILQNKNQKFYLLGFETLYFRRNSSQWLVYTLQASQKYSNLKLKTQINKIVTYLINQTISLFIFIDNQYQRLYTNIYFQLQLVAQVYPPKKLQTYMSYTQAQIDTLIYRLRRLNPEMPWKQITQEVNRTYKIGYSINDLINRYQQITAKLTKQQISQLFIEFQQFEMDFQTISARTGYALSQVKRQIMSGLVNNIWKVCFIVRKRKISNLKSNLLDNEQMKQLVVLMLKQSTLKNIKLEYNYFWNFISKHYPDDFFQTVSDEVYRSVYRELIILVQKFRINHNKQPAETSNSFEKIILQQNSVKEQDQIQSILQLAKNRKKTNKETIDLLSESENSQNQQNPILMTECDLQVRQSNNLLKETINLYYELENIEKALQYDPNNQYFRRLRIEKVVAIGCLKLIAEKHENV